MIAILRLVGPVISTRRSRRSRGRRRDLPVGGADLGGLRRKSRRPPADAPPGGYAARRAARRGGRRTPLQIGHERQRLRRQHLPGRGRRPVRTPRCSPSAHHGASDSPVRTGSGRGRGQVVVGRADLGLPERVRAGTPCPAGAELEPSCSASRARAITTAGSPSAESTKPGSSGCERLEGCQLAGQQRGGHVVVGAVAHPLAHQVRVGGEVTEDAPRAGPRAAGRGRNAAAPSTSPPPTARPRSRPTSRHRSLRSHGHRSSSVSGTPAAIFATLASGWSASPSAYVQPSAAASPVATVVLPDPGHPHHHDDLHAPDASPAGIVPYVNHTGTASR